MKTKKQPSRAMSRPGSMGKSDVRQEIDNFLRALSSYPDRFAREPYLSFQQHLSSIGAADHQQNRDHNGSRYRSG